MGTFDQSVGAAGFVTMKGLEYMSFKGGATLGSGIGTIGLALIRSLEVPRYHLKPAAKPSVVLVHGECLEGS